MAVCGRANLLLGDGEVMPKVSAAYWDWDEYNWRVILTDGYHTWHGRSLMLPIAYMKAFVNYLLDV